MMDRLRDEVALITGSTSGFGKVCARIFAAEGARVMVTGRNAERGAEVVRSICEAGGTAAWATADMCRDDEVEAAVAATLEEFGELTVLVNNAIDGDLELPDPDGVKRSAGGTVVDVTAEGWRRYLETSVIGTATYCRLAIPAMIKAGRGSIINITSLVAGRGIPRHGPYSAVKGAQEALTRSIAVDFGHLGIRCNAIRPGHMMHEVRDRDLPPERLEELRLRVLTTSLVQPEHAAYAAVYLASRESESVTGIVLPVDGGAMVGATGGLAAYSPPGTAG
jgi:3-oxoacyl-[acyl-carrier protein] reductase